MSVRSTVPTRVFGSSETWRMAVPATYLACVPGKMVSIHGSTVVAWLSAVPAPIATPRSPPTKLVSTPVVPG